MITSCSCTVADLQEKSLQKGQKTTLTLNWTIPDSIDKDKDTSEKACVMYQVCDSPPGKDVIQYLVVALNPEFDGIENKEN